MRLHYLAYGSNLHPLRLAERAPSARFVGVGRLPGCEVLFHKRGKDGSGKCDLVERPQSESYGALYEIDATDKGVLDRAEGAGVGYRVVELGVEIDGVPYSSFFYSASPTHVDPLLRPFDWYRALVVAGARYHRFPESYVRVLEAVDVVRDPDRRRSERMSDLVSRIRTG